MKIRCIRLFEVRVPFGDTAYTMGKQSSVSSIAGLIVAVETDADIVGWGEMVPWGSAYLPEFAEGVRAGLALLCPKMIGADPINLAAVNERMDAELYGHGYAKSALDMACWDIFGKAAGQPLHTMLGGCAVESAPLNCAVYNGPPQDMISRIEAYRAQGIRIFSTKPSGDPDADIELYRAIADQRLDGETYIADANRTWTVPIALRVARTLEQYGFFNLEQPCNSYEECLKVRRRTRLTTALDESVTDFDALSKAARDDAADIVHIKLSRVGGITRAKQIRDFCVVAGLSLSWAASGGIEISDAAATHVALSTPSANLFGLWNCREFNTKRFAEGGPTHSDGRARMPDLPGLGVEPLAHVLGAPVAVFGRDTAE